MREVIDKAKALMSTYDQLLEHTRTERDQLRAELKKLQLKLSAAEDAEDVKNGAINNLTADNARLREAAELGECYMKVLRHELASNNANFEGSEDQMEVDGDLAKVQSALAATPAQSLESITAPLKQHIERLRAALAAAKTLCTAAWTGSAHVAAQAGHDFDDCWCIMCNGYRKELNDVSDAINNALAATPAQPLAAHDAAVKVAVLREVANKFESTEIDTETREPSESYDCGYKDGQYSAVNRIMAEADRIAKEAGRG